jgi:hypothetical protein
MSGWNDTTTVFYSYTINTRIEIGGETQLVGNSCGEHIFGTHRARQAVYAVGKMNTIVGNAIQRIAGEIVDEIIANNTMDSRNRARVDACMSRCGKRRDIVDRRILAIETVLHKPLETAIRQKVVIAIEVVPAHLVYNYTNNNFWAAY